MSDPVSDLTAHGVSIWLDDLSRDLIVDGRLARLIAEQQVTGITSNPTIFAAALASGDRYRDQLRDLAERRATIDEAVFEITTADVRAAADLLAPVYRATGGTDGRVSIEVDPRLSEQTGATVDEARRLWRAVDRPNIMVKIPATRAGLPAISAAISEGISVNVTLIFGVDRYRAVIEAYLAGLEQARSTGVELAPIRSVASFFISRVDTLLDARLTAIGTPTALALRGRGALANARVAYRHFEQSLDGERWRALAEAGAHPQRPLWASTGVKDPAYPDTRYVTELVAPATVNTMPAATLAALAGSGEVITDTVRGRSGDAAQVLAALAACGLDATEVADTLEHDGVEKFDASWAKLRGIVDDAMSRLVPNRTEEADR